MVLRPDDTDGRAVVATSALAITEVLVYRSGQVAALNRGLSAIHSDITAITDDDTAPHPDWIARLLGHFADEYVAGVGGRDIVVWRDAVIGIEDGLRSNVGRVGPYGQIIGNHHRGTGPVQAVDILKGANMAFRTAWLRRFGFDERLRGIGLELHNDLTVCLQIRRAGGRLLYDPEVLVDHYPAPRPDDKDDRTPGTVAAMSDEVHNETLALMEFLPGWRRLLWLLSVVLGGTRRYPGLAVSLVLLPSRRWSVLRALVACCRGRAAGVMTWRTARVRA